MREKLSQTRYTFRVEDGICCIEDDSNTFGGPSVTNTADAVIRDLCFFHGLPANMPFIYRDTDGIWDELLVKNGCFLDFAAIGERNLENAKANIQKKYRLSPTLETIPCKASS